MTNGGQYTVQHGGYEFIVSTSSEPPLCLTVHPLVLGNGDARAISVIKTTDTETLEEDFSVKVPEVHDGEHDMWGIGVRVASWVMANLQKLQEEEGLL